MTESSSNNINNMESGLTRFLEAQNSGDYGITFEESMRRLKDGKELKEGLCYIFPTLKEFGKTENDNRFGLYTLYEAYEYWAVPELRDRLKEATVALIQNRNRRTAE